MLSDMFVKLTRSELSVILSPVGLGRNHPADILPGMSVTGF